MPSAAGPRSAITRSILTMRALCDVCPCLSVDDATNLCLMHPVLRGEGALRYSPGFPFGKDLSHQGFIQFGPSDEHAPALTPLRNLVRDVVCMRSDEQVRWADTPNGAAVAVMQDAGCFDWGLVAGCQDVGDDVRQTGGTVQGEVASSIAASIAEPDPTRAKMWPMRRYGAVLIDSGPEAGSDGWLRILVGHRSYPFGVAPRADANSAGASAYLDFTTTEHIGELVCLQHPL